MSRPADQDADALEPWHEDWIARVTVPADGTPVSLTIDGTAGSRLSIAESHDTLALFIGLLTNADELDPDHRESPAQIVLRLYEREGSGACTHLRGPFATLVWNRRGDVVVVARDHIGIQPLFVARHGSQWLF